MHFPIVCTITVQNLLRIKWTTFSNLRTIDSPFKLETVEITNLFLLSPDDAAQTRMLQPEARLPVAVAIPSKLLGQETKNFCGREGLLVREGGVRQQKFVRYVLAGGKTRLQRSSRKYVVTGSNVTTCCSTYRVPP